MSHSSVDDRASAAAAGSPGEPPLELTACDLEPVHLAGAIQPHGVLLVFAEPGLALVQASANASPPRIRPGSWPIC